MISILSHIWQNYQLMCASVTAIRLFHDIVLVIVFVIDTTGINIIFCNFLVDNLSRKRITMCDISIQGRICNLAFFGSSHCTSCDVLHGIQSPICACQQGRHGDIEICRPGKH